MKKRWSTLLIAFVAKNIAMGATFGCFGLLLPVLVADFSTDVTTISFGIALISLMMGVAAPGVGFLLDRWSMAGTVAGGCLIAAAGFWAATEAATAWQFVLAYGLVGGLGVTAMGALPAAKLATTAFPSARGKAIGFAMLPLSGVVAPLLCAPLLVLYGWRPLLQGLAMMLVVVSAAAAVFVLKNTDSMRAANGVTSDPAHPAKGVFATLALSAGILLSSGILLVTYIAPHARDIGMNTGQAAALLALVGGVSMPGAYLFAWLADRISPARVLMVNAALQSALWLALAWMPAGFGVWVAAGLAGLCAGGANPSFSVFIANLYGQQRFGAMLGRLALIVVPFNMVAAPLAGWSFDVFGDYSRLLVLEAMLCATATVILLRLEQRLSHAS